MSIDEITQSFLNFKNGLSRIISEIVRDPIEVEDILQEAYIKSFEANKKQTISSPKAFMAQTARNLALNYIARSSVKYNVSTQEKDVSTVYSNAPGMEEQLESEKRFKRFCDAVQDLPVNCRRVFVLKQIYGMSQKEIAKRLNISEKTVEYHVGKGLLRCKKYLDSSESSKNSIVEFRQKKTGSK